MFYTCADMSRRVVSVGQTICVVESLPQCVGAGWHPEICSCKVGRADDLA